MKTKVSFHILEDEVIAIFPELYYHFRLYGTSVVDSYMHEGQHGGCAVENLKLPKASADQYKDLQKELESIGYNLEII